MDVKKLNLKDIDSASKFYPSVDCGPIDTTRVKELLGWNPTPFVSIVLLLFSHENLNLNRMRH